jgi:arginyl-tRNA synthetase
VPIFILFTFKQGGFLIRYKPMNYVYDQIRAQATEALLATNLITPAHIALAEPKGNLISDLALPVFAAAKAASKNPADLAKEIAESITFPSGSLIARAEASGGFVNFFFQPTALATQTLEQVMTLKDQFGTDKTIGKNEKIIVEYSSPNIARKMHVGHLRSTVIGHSLRQIFIALGYDVIADNHLGDWGTNFGMLLAAIDQDKLTPWDDPDPVQSLVELYANFNAKIKENPALQNLASDWFKKLEDGDVWAKETWQRLIDITMVEFNATYKRLGVSFDTYHGESYFESMMPGLIADALAKGVAKVEESGAISVTFDEDGKMPSCLLQKSNGGTLYQTRDAATCIYRLENYAPTRNIYVVGAEQKLHFQQVFEIVRRLGYAKIADVSVHISFGKVSPPEGKKFSMREGNVVFLNDVLDEAYERAKLVVDENIASGSFDIPKEDAEKIAEMLGTGAVIYSDLYQGPDRNITFDWDKMLSPVGNTATYIQYTHARCKGILRNAEHIPTSADANLLIAPAEQVLLKHLAKMPAVVREAGEKYLPAMVADWTYNLAREFARFYEECPVLKAPTPELREARLLLVVATAQGIKNGMALLGIGVPERM